MNLKSTIIITLTIFIIGCVTPLAPEFNRNIDEAISEVVSLQNFEDVQINWTTHNGNPQVNILELSLINGENLPTEESEIRKLGLVALRKVIASINNADQYQHIVVRFKEYSQTQFTESSKDLFVFEFALEELTDNLSGNPAN